MFALTCGNQDVADAGVLGLGHVEGHVHQRHAAGVGAPGRFVAGAVGSALDHRDAEAGEFVAAALGVEHDLGIDQHIHHPRVVDAREALDGVVGHHRPVQRHGDGAPGLDAAHQVVDQRGLFGGDVLALHGDADHRRAMVAVDLLPVEKGLGRRQYQLRVVGMVDADLREYPGLLQIGPGFTALDPRQRLHEQLEVVSAAVDEVGMQALGEGVVDALPARAVLVHHDLPARMTRKHAGKACFDGAQDVVARGVEQDPVVPGEQAGIDGIAQFLDKAGLQLDALALRQVLQQLVLARRHGVGGDDQQTARLGACR